MADNKRKRSEDEKKKVSPLEREDGTKAPARSILEASEVAFPRGGASALTPLELKEVANEAVKDVLFERENETGAKSSASDDSRPKKRKKTTKSVKSKDEEEEKIPIETLTFKSLQPGAQVLGQIQQIDRLDITLALADNLVGYIPITSISPKITEQLEKFQEENDSDENEDVAEESTTEKKFPILTDMFRIGQWLRAVVVESTSNNSKKQKKRIQLSIEVEKTNDKLDSQDDFVANSTVQASVRSVEDHGIILDVGKPDLSGFISNREVEAANYKPELLVPGSVFLATIVSKKGRTVTVKFTSNKKNVVSTLSSIDSIVPGNIIDALITEVLTDGIVTKAFGLVDATINLSHLGIFNEDDIKHKFSVGSTIKARVLAVLTIGGSKKLYISILPHVINFDQDAATVSAPLEAFPIGHVFDSVEVKGHNNDFIFVKISEERTGEVHFSRINNDTTTLSTTYGNGTNHKARVLGFSQINNSYILTLDSKIIEQKYLRPQDIPLGELVTVEILKVSSENGLLVKIFDKFEANVPLQHLSDVKLIYPERKFKIGAKVKGRVFSVSKYKSEIVVTLKKSLVGTENLITKIEDATIGQRTSATVISFKPSGALVSFFGDLKGFLPKSEISETFVKRPEDHLRLGQTITVRVISVDVENKRIAVSCKLSGKSTGEQNKALEELVIGRSIVHAQITEKSKDSIVVELPENRLKGVISVGHLSDGNYEQNRALLKRLEVGSTIKGLVIEKNSRSNLFNLSAKQSLIDSAEKKTLPIGFSDIKLSNTLIPGYIKSITDSGLFVAFAGRLVGLVLAKYATQNRGDDLKSRFYVNQSISVRVLRIDAENERFLLSLKEKKESSTDELLNPVDDSLKSVSDIVIGKITKATIKTIKASQLIVNLADNVQGLIDVSDIFDNFDDIKDPKHPLEQFKVGEPIDVKITGFYEARSHTQLESFSKISKTVVVELTAKKSDLKTSVKPLTFDQLEIGSELTVYVNSVLNGFYFVNIGSSIKGSISILNLTDDAVLLKDITANFPLGSALKARVKAIDTAHKSVTLTARKNLIGSLDDAKVGSVLPARVLRVTENLVIVELSEKVTASAHITEALDDYTTDLADKFSKNDSVNATVLEVNESKNRIYVSLRSDNPKDRLIRKSGELKRGDTLNGFIKNIIDKGVFVSLGRNVTGYVKVSDLSDSYIKEWKKFYKVNQKVVGKVIDADDEGHVTLTLKESEVNGKLNVLKRFDELQVGEVYEGTVRSTTDFGVFVKLDGTLNVSGLAHHSQISDNTVADLKALFGEGDRVKVKILKIDTAKKQLSLGMKASYFQEDGDDDVEMEDVNDDASDEEIEDAENDSGDEEDDDEIVKDAFNSEAESDDDDSENSGDNESDEEDSTKSSGLKTNGFDWTASILDQVQDEESSDEEDFSEVRNKKKKKTTRVVEDTTGDIHLRSPQSVADFERLIIGNPNSSIVWMNYMSFQLQLTEIDKAREIAERALKTINYREEQEKLNIWIAMLNLENTFGTEDSLEEVFKRSTEYMDSLTMHQKLVSIYIISEKFDKADSLFKVITKKFGKTSVSVWISLGSYLLDRGNNEKAREVLGNALKSLPKRDHIEVVRKFAQLEFTKGDAEQGRTLFEGLIADASKRIDLWNVYIDQEIKKGEKKKAEELFERVLTKKVTRKQAKFFFAKWLLLEEKEGDSKGSDYVKAKAQEYVQNQQ